MKSNVLQIAKSALCPVYLLAIALISFESAQAAIVPTIIAFPASDGIGGTISGGGPGATAITTTGTLGTSATTGGPANNTAATIGIWGGSATGTQTGILVTNTVAGLTYSGLASLGGSFVVQTLNTVNNAHVGVQFTNTTSGNIYASFLLRMHAASVNNRDGLVCFANGTAGSTINTALATLGINTSGQLGISTAVLTGTPTVNQSTALTVDQTYFIVMRYDIGSGQFDVWRNPTPGTSEPAGTGDLTLTTATGQTLSVFGLSSYNGGPNTYMDDFRLSTGATGWADVTPSGACIPTTTIAGPTNQSATVGGTATFAITPDGSVPLYQWQESVDHGASWNNVGINANSYTTPTLLNTDNGDEFQCIVSSACINQSVTSSVATLTVADPSGKLFRSFQSGNWSDTSTWQESTDGSTWVTATATPNNTSSNITIQATHVVTVIAPVTADQLTVQAGGELDASGATLDITASGVTAIDGDIFGTLGLADVAGSTVTANGPLTIENGGSFNCALHTAATIPTATWAPNSTCQIAPAAAGAFVPGGLGQNFGNFVWNWPSQSGSVALAGALTTVAGNFTTTAGSTLTLAGAAGGTLNIGGSFTNNSGAGKVLLQAGTSTGLTLNVNGNFINSGTMDANSSGTAPVINFTGTGTQMFVSGARTNPGHFSYGIANGSSVIMGDTLGAFGTFANSGTLNFSAFQFTGAGDLILNSSGTVIGNGTAELTTALTGITYDGTLNLPNLPTTLNNGDAILLFGAASPSAYTVSTFATIVPTQTPVTDFTWDQTQLATSGTLFVGAAGVAVFQITSSQVVGNQLILSGTGGTPLGNLTVVTTTAVTNPIASWTTWTTGTCDASGNFSVTNTVSGAVSFYRASHP